MHGIKLKNIINSHDIPLSIELAYLWTSWGKFDSKDFERHEKTIIIVSRLGVSSKGKMMDVIP